MENMKKTNKMRLTALVVACISIFMLSVSSYAESDWQQITSIDFSSSLNIQKPELTGRFDAAVKNGALEMKSDDVCEWVASVGWVCSVADVSVSADSVESELIVSVD